MPRRKSFALLSFGCALSLFCSGASVRAAEEAAPLRPAESPDIGALSLEDLLRMVVTPAKKAQGLQEAPSIVEIVSFRDIRRRGYRTVGEALRNLAGISVIDDHVYWNVGVRGVFGDISSANEIVKVMINGQPTFFRPTSVNFMEYDLIPVEAVERIEVIRGPGSALYGANAFLGVINIITWKGGEPSEVSERSGRGLALDGYYLQNEAHESWNGSASLYGGAAFGPLRYFVAGTFHRADRSGLQVPGLSDVILDESHRTDPAQYPEARGWPSPGWDLAAREYMLHNSVSKHDLERSGSFYGVGTYQLSDVVEFQLDGHLQYSDKFSEFQDFSFLTHGTRLTYFNSFARAKVSYGGTRQGGFSANGFVTYATGSPTDDERVLDRLVVGMAKRRKFGYRALDAGLELGYALSADDQVGLGVDYTVDREDLLSIEDINLQTNAVSEEEGFGEKTLTNLGAFGQLLWSPVKRLNVTLGVRADRNSLIACDRTQWSCVLSRKDKTVPASEPGHPDIVVTDRGGLQLSSRAALVYGTEFLGGYGKVIYGSSFKPPSPYQLYHKEITINGSSTGNPLLKPQTADTLEAYLGLTPAVGLQTDIVVFYTRVHDLVVHFKEASRVEGRNADVTLNGIEARAHYELSSRFTVHANVSYLFTNTVSPKKNVDETEFQWQSSPFNERIRGGMYPRLLGNFGCNIFLPDYHLNANANVNYVGERDASFVNNQLNDRLDLTHAYRFPSHFVADMTLSSVGLYALQDREIVFSMSIRGAPGDFAEPGNGGIDIPSLGPRLYFRVEQQF